MDGSVSESSEGYFTARRRRAPAVVEVLELMFSKF